MDNLMDRWDDIGSRKFKEKVYEYYVWLAKKFSVIKIVAINTEMYD
jgi:hypothetical protein